MIIFKVRLTTWCVQESKLWRMGSREGDCGFFGSWGSSCRVPLGLARTSCLTGQVSQVTTGPVSLESTLFKVCGESKGQSGGVQSKKQPLRGHPLWLTSARGLCPPGLCPPSLLLQVSVSMSRIPGTEAQFSMNHS